MNMKFIRIIILLVIVFVLSGCVTTVVRAGGVNGVLYPATKADVAVIQYALDDPPKEAKTSVVVGLSCLDMPISVVSDTILLPYDLIRRNSCMKKQQCDSFD